MTAPDLAALSEAYTKSPNALSLTLLGHALVDEYRACRLVQIDEGMRERVETCLRNIEKRATVQPDEIGNAKQLEINCYKILAHLADLRAAIAAMRGGAK